MNKSLMIWKICNLAEKGRTDKAIARELGIHRQTVKKYRKKGLEKSLKYLSKMSKRKKHSNPPMDEIKKILEREPRTKATAIYDQLIEYDLYKGSERTIQRIAKELRPEFKVERKFEPVTDMAPGFQAQVDLGECRSIIFKDKKKKVYFITFVLSFSRLKYVEYYDVPINTFIFLNFHKKAFEFIGGIPEEIVYDQTKLAVLKEKHGEIEFNQAFYRFSKYYGFTPYICNKYDAPTKGKVENAVKFVKNNFLIGREFNNFNELKERGMSWLERRANGKECKATGIEPVKLFERYEKDKLKKIPGEGIKVEKCFEKRNVNQLSLFSFNGKFYSVYDEYQCQDIYIFYDKEKIYMYDLNKNYLDGHKIYRGWKKIIKKDKHYRGKKVSLRAPQTKEFEDKVKSYIDEKLWKEFFENLKKRFPRHYREQLMGIIELSTNYDSSIFKEALIRAVYYHSISWGNISKICNALKDKSNNIPVVPLEVDLGMRIDVVSDEVEERKPEYYQELLFK